MKKFDSITRYKTGFRNWNQHDTISITEKIDGANASIRFTVNQDDSISDLSCYSRRQKLTPDNRLRGFYEYAHENLFPKLNGHMSEVDNTGDLWGDEIIVYGEWLVSHTVTYKEECYFKFYPFAVYNVTRSKYMSPFYVKSFTDVLELTMPKILYYGQLKDITLEQILEFVGKSPMTLDSGGGEGVVVWNTEHDDPEQCRVKFISDKFSEVSNTRPQKVYATTESEEWISQFITESRATKALHKLNDEGAFPAIEFKNFKDIASPTVAYVYDDIVAEESDSLPSLFDEKQARKRVGKLLPLYIRKFIDNYEINMSI